MTKSRLRPDGFTLIELLAVIGIIAVLAAILIPVIGSVRSQARASTSVSNLRQIYVALTMHADENRERFPMSFGTIDWDSDETDPSRLSWAQRLRPYGLDLALFLTPRFERSGSAYFLGTRAAFVANNNAAAAVRRDRIRFPSQFVLAGETNYPFLEPDFDKDDYSQNCLDLANGTLLPGGTQAILFADGHVIAAKTYDAATMTFRYDSMSSW